NGTGVSLDSYSPGPTGSAPYYWAENKEYTSGKVTATSGQEFDQAMTPTPNPYAGMFRADYPWGEQEFNDIAKSGQSARGGYILMSAGIDRLYGHGFKGSTRLTTDDIVQ